MTSLSDLIFESVQCPDRIVLEEHRTRLVIDEGEEGEEHGQQRHHDQQDDGEAAVWQQE